MMQCWLTSFGEETDYFTIGRYCTDLDLRQFLVETLHPEFVQIYLCQFAPELSALRRIDIPIPCTDRRLIVQRVGEGENSTPRHCPLSHAHGWWHSFAGPMNSSP